MDHQEINRLALAVKDGDASAEPLLLKKISAVIKKYTKWRMKVYWLPGYDFDDLQQELSMAALKVTKYYDPTRGNFTSLALKAMQVCGYNIHKRMARFKRQGYRKHSQIVSTPPELSETEGHTHLPTVEADTSVDFNDFTDNMLNSIAFSPREKEIFILYIKKFNDPSITPLVDMVTITGYTSKFIDNTISRIKDKIRYHLIMQHQKDKRD